VNVSELFVRCLENEGVRYVFRIPGEENLDLMDALPARFASSFTTHQPMLWRVRAYSSPGFPSPMTSQSAAKRGPPPEKRRLNAMLAMVRFRARERQFSGRRTPTGD
jgi:Thiamine pyrophosphate enzyme, N-terminal TPP binding domain